MKSPTSPPFFQAIHICLQTLETPQRTRSLGEATRPQFPILEQHVNGKPLIYLDNSATSQKPNEVIQAMDHYYGPAGYNSNVHRGVHHLSSKATAAYEQARDKIAKFINARSSREIVFVKNATEGLNLIANTWGTKNIKEGDEVSFVIQGLQVKSNFWHVMANDQLCIAS